MERIGILLVGHGSKFPFNKDLVESTGKTIAERHPEYIVKCVPLGI
jgi:sirohydrochlorin cobalto/nickelchelatase